MTAGTSLSTEESTLAGKKPVGIAVMSGSKEPATPVAGRTKEATSHTSAERAPLGINEVGIDSMLERREEIAAGSVSSEGNALIAESKDDMMLVGAGRASTALTRLEARPVTGRATPTPVAISDTRGVISPRRDEMAFTGNTDVGKAEISPRRDEKAAGSAPLGSALKSPSRDETTLAGAGNPENTPANDDRAS